MTCIAGIAVVFLALIAQAVPAKDGVRVVWQEPQPQPYYYLVYRQPAGHGFPIRVNPNFGGITAEWTDAGGSGKRYKYRVCSVYSPDRTVQSCSGWFAPSK